MTRHLVGYFIRRTALDQVAMRGHTMCAYPHTLYPTRALAEDALTQARLDDALDPRWAYDVCAVWMCVEDDTSRMERQQGES